MKVEVIDKRNPVLVRVATIIEIENHMVKIHFDGWLDIYDYWLDDDSSDLHPPGWCAKTGHPLVPPICKSRQRKKKVQLRAKFWSVILYLFFYPSVKTCV